MVQFYSWNNNDLKLENKRKLCRCLWCNLICQFLGGADFEFLLQIQFLVFLAHALGAREFLLGFLVGFLLVFVAWHERCTFFCWIFVTWDESNELLIKSHSNCYVVVYHSPVFFAIRFSAPCSCGFLLAPPPNFFV